MIKEWEASRLEHQAVERVHELLRLQQRLRVRFQVSRLRLSKCQRQETLTPVLSFQAG